MPQIIPPFVQYQAPIVPLRGLWNSTPPEGNKMISCEIDWTVSPPGSNVQFSFSGNSPVAISQIVALQVDNSRCGDDAIFQFADSGSRLIVPARTQLVTPVFTNGLMFYCGAAKAVAGDITAFLVFNSMPPPVPIAAPTIQNTAIEAGIVWTNGTTQIVPAGVNGTLNGISLTLAAVGGAAEEQAQVTIQDGTGKVLWTYVLMVAAGATVNLPVTLNNLNLRFVNGLQLVVAGSTITGGGAIFANLYYSQP